MWVKIAPYIRLDRHKAAAAYPWSLNMGARFWPHFRLRDNESTGKTHTQHNQQTLLKS